jgi:hypothetical protein
MASSKWKSWEELELKLTDKELVFWGASNWVERTMNKLDKPVAYIVDNSQLNQDIEYCGYQVYAPRHLISEDKERVYIVIATANYMSVIDELESMGFTMGDHYCCSPVLNQRKDKDELLSHQQTILISSQQHWFDDKAGGGVYKFSLNPQEVVKVYSGKCRGLAKADGKYFAVDMLKGIVVMDSDFKEIDLIEIQKNSEPHGLYIDQANSHVYVGQPGRDSIAIYSLADKKLMSEIFISEKWHRNRKDNHHVNDMCIHDGSLYVSLFSFTGNWLNEIYDGGVLEIDLATGKMIGPAVTGLWMPHSVCRIEGKLAYLNSMLGELYCGTYGKLGIFSGFVRGLDYDGKYFYIGTCEHRYPEKLQGLSFNISLDTGFFVFDGVTKMSRFFRLDKAETMHSLVVI